MSYMNYNGQLLQFNGDLMFTPDWEDTIITTPVSNVFTALNVPYKQNFNWMGLAVLDTSIFNDDPRMPGIYTYRQVFNVNPQPIRRSTLGVNTSNIGRFYNFGNNKNQTNRSLGVAYSSGTGNIAIGFKFINNTGSTITSLDVAYTGKQWRIGGSAGPPISVIPNTLDFEYQQAPSFVDLSTGVYISFPSLSFTSPNLVYRPIQTAIDGNLPENKLKLSATITVNIPNGEEIMLRWIDQTDEVGFDHQFGIDDLIVTPRG